MKQLLKNKKYIIVILLLITMYSCTSSHIEERDNDMNSINVDTVYHENGKIKSITSYINHKKYGKETIFDTIGNYVSLCDYVNDTLDGHCIFWKNEYDYGTLYYYDMGKYIMYREIAKIVDEDLYVNKKYFIQNDTIFRIGYLFLDAKNLEQVVDSISFFYETKLQKDTFKLDEEINIPILFHSKNYKKNVEIDLMLNNMNFIDSIFLNCDSVNLKVKATKTGKNKIRGAINYYINGDYIQMYFYKNFYVKEE